MVLEPTSWSSLGLSTTMSYTRRSGVIIKGKAEWIKPRYTKIYKDKLPDGKHVVAKAGTQISRSLLRSFETKSEAHLPKARERFVAKKLARPLRQWKMWSSNLKMIFGHICDKDCADFHRFHVAKGCQWFQVLVTLCFFSFSFNPKATSLHGGWVAWRKSQRAIATIAVDRRSGVLCVFALWARAPLRYLQLRADVSAF